MDALDDILRIDTPENVVFGYEVAGIGSRFLAALVDTVLIVLLQVVVNVLLWALGVFSGMLEGQDGLASWILAVFGLLAFAFFWGYYIFFEMVWNGQSPGKRWVGLRVIRSDGTPITLTESVIRNLVRLIDFLPLYYGIGVVVMFIDERSRRLGDLAAGTLVVHEHSHITLESLGEKPPLPTSDRPISDEVLSLPLERLTARDIQIIEEFLRRREELSHTSALALRLVRFLYDRMGVPLPHLDARTAERLLGDILRATRMSRSG